jgi:uncharacterized membrane protein YecN with MAPEG domain
MHTPITAFYAGLLGILFLYLSGLVIRQRLAVKVSLGDGDNKHLRQVVRAHANFSEYTPIVLILLFIAEVNGSDSGLLHVAGISILAGRFLHAFGLRRHYAQSWQRLVGMVATFGTIFLLAVLNILILY